jgi:protein-tyrosine-phosphatase
MIPPQKTILFLCTGNYYRSRFAENLFNSEARKLDLPWTAASKGLALERGVNNIGPMSESAVQTLRTLGAHGRGCDRMPAPATPEDFAKADRIVALKEAEHRPLLLDVEDDAEALPHVKRGGGTDRPLGGLAILSANDAVDSHSDHAKRRLALAYLDLGRFWPIVEQVVEISFGVTSDLQTRF